MDIETIRNIVLDIAEDVESIRNEDKINDHLATLEEVEERLNELIDEDENIDCHDVLKEIEHIRETFDETIYSLYSDEDEYENEYAQDEDDIDY